MSPSPAEIQTCLTSLQPTFPLTKRTAASHLGEQMDLTWASFLLCNPRCSSCLHDVQDKSACWDGSVGGWHKGLVLRVINSGRRPGRTKLRFTCFPWHAPAKTAHRPWPFCILEIPHTSLSIINNDEGIHFLRLRTVKKKKKKSEVLVEIILQDLYVGVAIKQVRCPCQPLGKLWFQNCSTSQL